MMHKRRLKTSDRRIRPSIQIVSMPRRLILCIAVMIALDLLGTLLLNGLCGNIPPRYTLTDSRRGSSSLRIFETTSDALHTRHPYDTVQKFDAVVVFCAGIGPHSGLDQTTVERLRFAAGSFHRGQTATIVGIGGHWRANRIANERQGMTKILRAAGVPPGAILQDKDSYDTQTNLDEFRRLANQYGWRHVAFVTSPLHMIRVRHLADLPMNASIDSGFAPGGGPGASESPSSPRRLEIQSLPFTAREQATLWAVWRETHHEGIAWAMTSLLPDDLFRDIMRRRRL
jgi:hypothetical protein